MKRTCNQSHHRANWVEEIGFFHALSEPSTVRAIKFAYYGFLIAATSAGSWFCLVQGRRFGSSLYKEWAPAIEISAVISWIVFPLLLWGFRWLPNLQKAVGICIQTAAVGMLLKVIQALIFQNFESTLGWELALLLIINLTMGKVFTRLLEANQISPIKGWALWGLLNLIFGVLAAILHQLKVSI
jgi:hypothetical protein